jgi:hypothetical protein
VDLVERNGAKRAEALHRDRRAGERVSGQQLDHFFDAWLFQGGRPECW